MTGRRAFWVFIIGVLVLSGQALAYASGLTVAMLKSDGHYPIDDILAGFKLEMQESNISFQMIPVEIEQDADTLAGQLIRMKADMILCIGVKALEKAALATKIPKLYVMVTSENAKTWSHRDDIFGVSLDIAPQQQFRIIRQALPAGRRIGVLYDPDYNQKMIEETKKTAAAAGFSLVAHPVSSMRDIPSSLQKMEGNVDMLWAIYDQTAYSSESTRYILLQSLRRKIPMVGLSTHFAKAGALLAIYGDYTDMGRQIALQAMAVTKKGERVPQMSRPRKVRVAVNEKVGRMMEINFSESFLKTIHQIY